MRLLLYGTERDQIQRERIAIFGRLVKQQMYFVSGWYKSTAGHECCLQVLELVPVFERDGKVDIMRRTSGVEAEHMGHQHVACGRANEKIIAAEFLGYRVDRRQYLEKHRIDRLIVSYRVHAE